MKDSKEHIMKTAFVLFMRKSYKAVTLREIIAESGFSNGAFYHYFKTKEELFTAVANHYWFEFITLPFSPTEGVSLKEFIREALNRSIEVMEILYDEYCCDDGETANLYSFLFEAYRIIPDFKERMLQAHNKEIDVWVKVIDDAKQSGEIRSDLQSVTIARYFLTTSYGNVLTSLINQDEKSMAENFRSLWENLYDMLRGCSESPSLVLSVSEPPLFTSGSLAVGTPTPPSPDAKIIRPDTEITSAENFEQPLKA